MSEKKPKVTVQRAFLIYKDESMGEWANAYGLIEVDIDKETLIKHGKVISKSDPDIPAICLNHLDRKVRESLGI